MRVRGPFVTLAVGVVMGSVLYGMSAAASTVTPVPAGAKQNAAAPTPTAPPSESAPAAPAPAAPAEPAPAEPNVPTNVSYAGKVDGAAATLAIAVKEGTAIAYLCDGKKVEAWLQGPATVDGKLNLTSTKLNALGKSDTLVGNYSIGNSTGTVTVSDKIWTFTLQSAAAPAGLYRASANVRNAKVVGGWIVLADGTQVGVMTVNEVPTAAPPLNLQTRSATVDGTKVLVEPVGSDTARLGTR